MAYEMQEASEGQQHKHVWRMPSSSYPASYFCTHFLYIPAGIYVRRCRKPELRLYSKCSFCLCLLTLEWMFFADIASKHISSKMTLDLSVADDIKALIGQITQAEWSTIFTNAAIMLLLFSLFLQKKQELNISLE